MRHVVLFRAGTSELAKPRILDDGSLGHGIVSSFTQAARGQGAQSFGHGIVSSFTEAQSFGKAEPLDMAL